MNAPETRFTRLGSERIAYQLLGEGPMDIAFCTGVTSSIDHIWDEPDVADVLRSIASYSRLILFDPRGIGASDALPAGEPFGWEPWVEDLRTVLDAVGSERAAIIAYTDGCALAMLFAATEPARTAALVLVAGTARYTSAEDYPYGFQPEDVQTLARWIAENWATDAAVQTFWPSRVDDPRFTKWFARYQRAAASPGKIEELYGQILRLDSRHALPLISAPTLVVATQNPVISAEQAQFVADHIDGARLVSFPTKDVAPWLSHTDDVSALMEEFLTGTHRTQEPQRKLATVLFTDIVASTELAAQLGDRRWRRLLDDHDRIVRERVDHCGGRLIKTTGDGALATFEGPAKAIGCSRGLREELSSVGVRVRCGLHAGEVDVRDDDVGGIAVHIAARVMAEAEPGEIMVSRTVKDLVVGSGIEFLDRGEHELRGLEGRWQLFAYRD